MITNIPFSQSTEHGRLYDIETENGNSICIQHCIKAINSTSENGRVVLICGDDALDTRTGDYDRLREYMFKNSDVHSVVSLPPGVFSPYSSTVKTNIIYMENVSAGAKKRVQKAFWYFKVKQDGFSFTKNRKPIMGGRNDLESYLMHRNSRGCEGFTEVSVMEISSHGYSMVPFLDDVKTFNDATLLEDVTTENSARAGDDYDDYQVGTVAARARNVGGIMPKSEYYSKNIFQSDDRRNYKLVEPGQFVYRRGGCGYRKLWLE